jgi:hypothetical protein
MKLHQTQVILVASSIYQTGFGGMDTLKDKQYWQYEPILFDIHFIFTRLPLEKVFQMVLHH